MGLLSFSVHQVDFDRAVNRGAAITLSRDGSPAICSRPPGAARPVVDGRSTESRHPTRKRAPPCRRDRLCCAPDTLKVELLDLQGAMSIVRGVSDLLADLPWTSSQ